ncbi:hypothetical protein C6497_04690 [Candidatus Poribacteria bacterium]|nr:MAG: hypothetical protein C6497_04690 [Candidatus Poribacteria bacterium]
MLSRWAQYLFMISSFSPVILVFGISEFFNTENQQLCYKYVKLSLYIVIAIFLVIWCRYMIRKASKPTNLITIKVKRYSRQDAGLLSFVFVYLFPLIRSSEPLSIPQYILHFCVYMLIIDIMVNARTFQYNPIIRFLGYKFYTIVDDNNLERLLIIKRNLSISDEDVQIKQLAKDVYIVCNND